MFRTLLLVHVASTLYMVGLIWFVQLVHYPLFASVGRPRFANYEARHTYLTGWAVIPAMVVELVTATALAINPGPLPEALTLAGATMVVGIWGITFSLQVPCHTRLSEGFEPAIHRRLVTSNWARTVAWTARGGLVLTMLWLMLAP